MASHGHGTASSHDVIAVLAMFWMVAAAAGAPVGAVPPGAQTVEQLRAGLILTFARFVEWSPQAFLSASSPIVVGIVSDEAVAAALEATARGKNAGGRAIDVRRLQWDSNVAEVHMLFVGETEKRRLGPIIDRARERRIVTVSSLPDFGRAGGMITLTSTDGRIGFSVNSHATTLAAVHLSSFLLSHAAKVSDESGAGVR